MKIREKIFYLAAVFVAVIGFYSPCLAQFLEADIDIKPHVISTECTSELITIVVEPPDDYTTADIIPESVIISNIGGNQVNVIPLSYEIIGNTNDDTYLMLTYNCSDILGGITKYNRKRGVKITVSGTLSDGEAFTGLEEIKVKRDTVISALLKKLGITSPVLAKTLKADIDIMPDSLNLTTGCTNDESITIFVEPPEGYAAADIAQESIFITAVGGFPVSITPTSYQIIGEDKDALANKSADKDTDDDEGDKEEDNDTYLMLTYSCSAVLDVITGNNLTGEVEITVSGALSDGKSFTGSEELHVTK